jgi:Xaa-Pro aminopeptidase
VREAQAAGVAAVREGTSAGTVDQVCRDLITAAGHRERFVHGTGHGLGLEIHEGPILTNGATATLTTRMTVTVEPGVYLPGVGGVRIEDTVAVLPSGPEPLTTATHELVVL